LSDLPRPNVQQSVLVDEATIRQMVLSFPAGSSGGPDGLRSQHIRDLIMCREAGADLLGALTAFVNLVLSGRCPEEVTPVFLEGAF